MIADPELKPGSGEHGYIPRVMFVAPDGTLLEQFTNGRRGKHKYFYLSAGEVVMTMRKAGGWRPPSHGTARDKEDL